MIKPYNKTLMHKIKIKNKAKNFSCQKSIKIFKKFLLIQNNKSQSENVDIKIKKSIKKYKKYLKKFTSVLYNLKMNYNFKFCNQNL